MSQGLTPDMRELIDLVSQHDELVDALRDRSRAGADEESDAEVTDDTDMAETTSDVEDYPDEPPIADYQDDAVPTEDESDTVAAEPSPTEGDNGDTARN